MRKPLSRIYIGVLAFILAFALDTAKASAQWSWTMRRSGNHVLMEAKLNGTTQYQYRLGAGGSIRNIYPVRDNNISDLIAGDLTGSTNDRVGQSIFWALDVQSGINSLSNGQQRFNVNQGGAHPSRFSDVFAVDIDDNAKTVTVYVGPDEQWIQENRSVFDNGSDPVYQLVQYTGLADGVLDVRSVLRVPRIEQNGSVRNGFRTYYENWLPFTRDHFDRLCMGVDNNNNPNWFYDVNPTSGNMPFYPGFRNGATNGWGFLYRNGQRTTNEVVGVAWGRQTANRVSATASTPTDEVNLLSWAGQGQGVGLLPGLEIANTSSRVWIDNTVRIVVRDRQNNEFQNVLESASNNVRRTTMYGSNHNFTGTLGTLVDTLEGYFGQNGTATQLMGTVGPSNSGSSSSAFPDPNQEYWIDVANGDGANVRLSTNGSVEEPFLQTVNQQGSWTRWKFVARSDGLWHLQRAAGGNLPRLRTDTTQFADMQGTGSAGTWTRFEVTPSTTVNGAYYLTLPQAPSARQRLRRVGGSSRLEFVSANNRGNRVSWFITPAN